MIKSELIEAICKEQPHFSENDVALCVNTMFDKMIEQLSRGGRIEIRNFGNFDIRHHKPRASHNPKTGEKFNTEAKYVIHFKPGKSLKDNINASRHSVPIKNTKQHNEE